MGPESKIKGKNSRSPLTGQDHEPRGGQEKGTRRILLAKNGKNAHTQGLLQGEGMKSKKKIRE